MRLDEWKERLFDLGKSNRLVNFKDTQRSTIDLVFPVPDKIFRALTTGRKQEFFDVDAYLSTKAPKKNQSGNLPSVEDIEKNLKPGEVLAFRPDVPIRSLIKELARKAKESLTERGVNVLYAAFGFLHWKEIGNSRQEFTSPLVLIPIKISRESLVSPFVLQEYEDEILTNPTLLYKLRLESNLQLPTMTEDRGLSEYLDSVSVMVEKLGWSVSREVKIAPFSFLKMDMYLDLRDNEGLVLANPNARLIMDSACRESAPSPSEKTSETAFLHNVVNADSSQTAAILKAKNGENFVLQGPPGTGKSQTITNIIAEGMADGKRILFVSEKMAALQVVYANLKKVGLDDFCLELHSHKTNKKSVIDELTRVLHQPKTATNGKAFDEIAELLKTKRRLDGYASALHATVPGIGKSLYQVFGEISRSGRHSISGFLLRDIRKKKPDFLVAATEILNRYCGITPDLGYDYRKNPWHGFHPADVSFEHQKEAGERLVKILPAMEAIQSSLDRLGEILGSPLSSLDDFFKHQDFLGFLAGLSWHHPKIFRQGDLPTLRKSFENMAEISAGILRNRVELEAVFLPAFFEQNGETLWKELTLHFGPIFRRLGRKYQGFRSALLGLRKDPRTRLGHRELTRLAGLWKDEQAAREWFSELEPLGREILGERLFKGIGTEWNPYVRDLRRISGYMDQKMSMAGLCLLSTDEFILIQDQIKKLLEQFSRAWESARPCLDFLREDFDRDLFDPYRDEVGRVVSKLRLCGERRYLMEPWIRLLRLLDEARKMEILGFLDAALDARWPLEDFFPGFSRLYYEQWAHAIIEDDPVLRDFTRTYQDRAVQMFCEKDRLQFDIAQARIRESLSARRPSLDCLSPGSPTSILLRESQKKRNLMPVRILLREIPDLVQLLKPCFLMSPLSVSTYLDPKAVQFDTVIFDEASQIFPQDALGAIYRSKQVIVVGDTRQMPPSNFFTASVVSDEDFSEETYQENVADYESILDICATRFPQNRLKWHYRSQTEDLIAFSNAHYYDGSLVTFPSSQAAGKDFGVEFLHLPEGRFDRSTKTNQTEASFIANLVFTHFRDHPERSLGVVAFSLSQQEAIESLIEARRERDSSFEAFFAEDRKEPFFVKNLETVQGDERDTILFSIAYGKDSAGKFYHNFGPLNQAGGERRLNVAVTRAKMNVKVVSSIRALDIDLGRTQAVGVRFLKEYLEYAEKGFADPKRFSASPKGMEETGFDDQVMHALEQAGYEVDDEFGFSEFRIDLAVRKPGSKDHFLAVECDGIAYHETRDARDRDRLRREVLEKMGWKYYRIWSADWFKNTQVETERLLAFAAGALRNTTASAVGGSPITSPTVSIGENNFVEKKQPVFRFPLHEWADIPVLHDRYFYSIGFIGFLLKVVEVEGPVSIDSLLPRIAFLFDSTKVTQRVRDDFQERIKIALQRGQLKMVDGFLTLKLQETYRLRVPKDGEEKRDVQDISIPELAGGLQEITRQNIEVSKEGLIKTASTLLGLLRVGPAFHERMETAIAYLTEKGILVWNGNPADETARLSIPEKNGNR